MQAAHRLHSRKNCNSPSRRVRHKLAQYHLESLENRQLLSTTYYVAPTGSDTATGSTSAPFKTIQQGVSVLQPGDTLDIRSGTYAGFISGWDSYGLYITISGTPTAPITIQADPSATPGSVIINSGNNYTPDGIDLEPAHGNCDYVTIKGLTIAGNSNMLYGIRIGQSNGDQVLNCTVTNVGGFGIYSSFTTNNLIQGNTVSGTTGSNTTGHGIYVSNSAVNPIIRGNTLFNNASDALHMNGDISQGGTGLITGAVVEDNIIYNNATNGINCDGIQNSLFDNNLIYNNGHHGFAMYKIDAAAGSTNNVFVNNTVYEPSSSGAAIQLSNGATGATIFNNVLVGGNYGTLNVSSDSMSGLTSDYNVVTNVFDNYDTGATSTLAQWQSSSGQDKHSKIATAAQLFVNQGSGNYQLASASPAIDAGTASLGGKSAPTVDLLGNARPQGSNFDIGVYESMSNSTTPPAISTVAASTIGTTATVSWTTNELSSSSVQYGTTTNYGSTTAVNSTQVLSHSVALSGLSANTVYHYRVISANANGNSTTSADFTLTTPAVDLTPPVVSGITASGITFAGATIGWTTNEVADSQVQYGATTTYGSSTTLNSTLVTSHSVVVNGLTPSTLYHYRILTHDASGNLTTTADATFTTAALGAGPFSVFSNSTVPAIPDQTDTSAVVLGTKFQSDVAGAITGIRFYKGSLNTGTHVGYLWSSTGTLLASATFSSETASGWQTVTFSTPVAIAANTTYIAGYYAPNGEYAEQDNALTTSGIDAAPLHILASGVDGTNGLYVYGSAGTFPSNTYLNANYYVDVVFSPDSNPGTGVSSPPIISAVAASGLTTSSGVVSWTTNEAADSQVQYGTTTSYGSTTTLNSTLVTSHSVTVSGLQASATYHYRVLSKDSSGNLTTSGDFTFTTAAATTDTTAPKASLSAPNVIGAGGATYSIVVTYSDNVAVNVATLDSNDIVVTGPNGFKQTATFVSVNDNSNGTPRTATYQIMALGGTWDVSDNGLYTVTMVANQVSDTSGNSVAAGTLDTFSSKIPAGVDTTPPVVSNIASTGLTTGGATITWTTDESADSQVQYGTTTNYGSTTTLNSSLVTSHGVALSGLQQDTVYHYRVLSHDASGNLTVSGDFTFKTMLMGDINGDGAVNAFDLTILANHWLATVPVGTLGDISGPAGVPDGIVNAFDLTAMSNNWLATA